MTDQEHVNRIRWNFDCVKATFKLQWKEIEGQWTFIGPKDLLKSLATSDEEGKGDESGKDQLWAEAVWGAINDTPIPVRAELGAITVPLQKVLNLEVGDTFALHLSPEGHPAFVADQLTYQVSVGTVEGHRAVKVNQILKETEHD
ncbi:MAG: FliM/FliN family flagellar motor switch protein [Deltaproteobacteria bacterium]|nr:MAG: FliM/FliN family flagellar motor switch protein [Deltaproteobacteria bacterium]